MTTNPTDPTATTDATDAEMAHAVEFGSRNDAPDNVGPTEDDMNTPAAPEPAKPATRKPRTPAKSGDPRADRAAAAKKAATKKAAADKVLADQATRDEMEALTIADAEKANETEGWQRKTWTHNQAHAAYRKQRTALHGAGPEAYRKAAAKALGATDAEFEAAFFLSKATPIDPTDPIVTDPQVSN